MRNDQTIKNARRNLRIAQGNWDRAIAQHGTEGHGGSPLEYLGEAVEEAEVALKRLLDAKKGRTHEASEL